MKNAFILKDNIYSFKKANVDVYIKACNHLNISLVELSKRMNENDLESLVTIMYHSLRDSKDMTFEEFKQIDIEEFELLSKLFIEVNK
ncbi:MAG TPA: hypothetical protein K8V90_03000 [Romboutsia timonensis]|uniref:Uncharacterized protein n=1 Tax=Romboutsia timonensis TaxID=1776391 RepID=A0A921SYW1_9FIRM|nr:hypothetical protein [uncultured Romboutsia sp.]HJG96053.1 hypothetical protein [Romboutsia timonensis]